MLMNVRLRTYMTALALLFVMYVFFADITSALNLPFSATGSGYNTHIALLLGFTASLILFRRLKRRSSFVSLIVG